MSDTRLYVNIFWINILIATIEIIGRVITGSLTLLSDGFHQIGDAIGNLISIVAEHLVQKGWNEHKVRGWSGLAVIILLFFAFLEIMREAWERMHQNAIIDAPGMAIVAGIACALNGLAWYRAAKTKGAYTCGCAFHMHSEPFPRPKGRGIRGGWLEKSRLRQPFIFIRQLADSPFIRGLKTAAFGLGTSKGKNITSSSTVLHQKTDTLVSAVACLGGIGIAYTNTYQIDTLISMLIAAWLLKGIIVIGNEAVRMIRMT